MSDLKQNPYVNMPTTGDQAASVNEDKQRAFSAQTDVGNVMSVNNCQNQQTTYNNYVDPYNYANNTNQPMQSQISIDHKKLHLSRIFLRIGGIYAIVSAVLLSILGLFTVGAIGLFNSFVGSAGQFVDKSDLSTLQLIGAFSYGILAIVFVFFGLIVAFWMTIGILTVKWTDNRRTVFAHTKAIFAFGITLISLHLIGFLMDISLKHVIGLIFAGLYFAGSLLLFLENKKHNKSYMLTWSAVS